jgi:hypothetical protein
MSKVIGTLTVVFFLIVPTIIKFAFDTFNCMEIENGEHWLFANLEIRCWEGDHLMYALGCALPGIIIWVITIPALCLHFLSRRRDRLEDIRQKLKFGFLYHGFKQSRFYWEFVILYRKVILIALSVFLTNYSVNAQALTVLLTILVYLWLQYYYRPYTLDELNDLEIIAILITSGTIYAGLYYLTVEIGNSYVDYIGAVLLFVFVAILNSIFFILWFNKTSKIALNIGVEKFPRIRKILAKLHLDRFLSQEDQDQNAQTERHLSTPETLRHLKSSSEDSKLKTYNEYPDLEEVVLNLADKLKEYEGYIKPIHDDMRSESDEVYEIHSRSSTSQIMTQKEN